MSSAGENMPELERQRWLDRVQQHAHALQFAAAELKGDREIVLAAVAQDGRALKAAAAELKGDAQLLQVQSINPKLSATVLVAELRLHLAYTLHDRVGRESLLKSLPLELIERIGQHITIRVAVHGLICRPPLR